MSHGTYDARPVHVCCRGPAWRTGYGAKFAGKRAGFEAYNIATAASQTDGIRFTPGVRDSCGVGGVAFMIHWLHRISWNFSAGYTLLGFADLPVGWLLAGLVVAKVAVR